VTSVIVAPARPRKGLRALFHFGSLLVGVAVLVLLIRHVGVEPLSAILARSLRWLPLLLVLESARIAGDAGSTFLLYRHAGHPAPTRELIRAHVLAYPVGALMPAGRAASEALKAQELAPYVGGTRAAAAATMNQTLALVCGGIASIPCILAALVTGASALTLALVAQASMSLVGGFIVQFVVRRRTIGSWIGKRFARAGRVAADYQGALDIYPRVPSGPLLVMLAFRAFQVAQYAVLLHAVGGEPTLVRAILAYGVSVVGSTAGDLIPGQVGATDSAFALSASMLGLTAANAVGISVLYHLVQVIWSILGSIASLLWKPGATPGPMAIVPSKSD
jgi:hypothetical protein